MARFKHPLAHVRVASPCKADWDQMIGDEHARFCGQCNLNVYNLSGMTRDEAEGLIARTEGRLCVRFYRRRDGSILTSDCPVGLGAIRQRLSYLRNAIAAAAITLLATVGFESLLTPLVRRPQVTMGVMRASRANHLIEQGDLAVPQPHPNPTMGQAVVTPTRRPARRK